MRGFRLRRSDLPVPALLAVVGAVEIAAAAYEPVRLALATYALAALASCASRLLPLAVPLLVAGIYALTPRLGFDVSQPASWVLLIAYACFATGLHVPRARTLAGLASVVAVFAAVYATLEWLTDFEPSVLFGLIATVGAWALGRALGEALDQNRRAGAEAERARLGGAQAASRAARAERERIAAELHDVLAHALGAMVVQSSVARDRIGARPAAAEEALRAVAQAGREALLETGRLLRLLRDDRDELGLRGGAAPAASEEASDRAAVAAPLVTRRDAALPALLASGATFEVLTRGYGYGTALASIAVCWLAAGVLSLRRAFPLAMPVAVTALLVGSRLVGVEVEDLAVPVVIQAFACFSAGRHAPAQTLWALASVGASIALLALDAVVRGEVTADAVFVFALIGSWAAGVALRETLQRTRTLAAEAEHARLEQQLAAERATAEERKRIARELHDVLANSLSVMIVQASLAADLVGGDRTSAAVAVSEVERAGRNALGEIGRLLRLIGSGAGEPGTQPQHGVADLPALAEEYGRAGLTIDLDIDGVAPLPMGVDLSAYRIVQEGLTNALKHAPGSPVRVRLARRGAGVVVEVSNGPASSSTPAAVPSGHGLIGLRERVSLFGGSLETRTADDGGFVLAATIPLAAEAA